MPDVSQAEIGRRMYHIHREKRVEHSIKLVQESLGASWRSLKEAEIETFGHVLQCTGNTVDQKRWEQIPFQKMDQDTLRKILALSGEVSPGHNPFSGTVAEIRKILLAL